MKFDYFNNQKWECQYKQEAKDIINDVYKEYKGMHAAEANIGTVAQEVVEDEYTAAFVRKRTRMQQSGSGRCK